MPDSSDAHHGISLGYGESGTGTKACDLLTMPLCRPCHNLMHLDNAQGNEMKSDQWRYIAKTLQKAIKDDVIFDLLV